MRSLARTVASMTVGVAVSFTGLAAAVAPAEAASSGCSADFASYAVIGASADGAQARAAQCLLEKAGYEVDTDGSFSADDAKVLARFQRSVNLKADGSTDAQTWSALIAQGNRKNLKKGSSGGTVERLQLSLRAAGYGAVPVTGSYDAKTRSAVKKLQKKQNWRQTGHTGPSVWRALQAGGAVQVKGPEIAKKRSKKAVSIAKGKKALAFAKRQLGDRYRYGASGPNAWDCSGLTQGAWKSAGVKLPHNARMQFRKGKKVSRANLRAGDLVFFYRGISHVGIYAGNGKIVHAARSGQPVEYSKIKYMPYEGARRVG